MVKKFILIVGLALFSSSIAYADVFSKSEKDFNEQVMTIMKDVENKSIDQGNVDAYMSHVKASDEVKQAVKSNIQHHLKYSNYHKVEDGIYLCKKDRKAMKSTSTFEWNAKCSALWGCVWSFNSICGLSDLCAWD